MEPNEALAIECAALRASRALRAPHSGDALERYLAELKRVSDDVLALGDGMGGETWFRTHSHLVSHGIWAKLAPVSKSVYVVLSACADKRKRCTIVGVRRVAQQAGYSVSRVLYAYAELKRYGLIWRRRVKLGGRLPYLTGLYAPSRWRSPLCGRGRD